MIVYTFSVPGDLSPFYIGKGRPERPTAHFTPTNLGKKTHFYNKLNFLLLKGIYPEIKIVASGLSEKQAFDLEINLIQIYGRQDNKTGCLANHTDGGDGCSGNHQNLGRERSLEHRLAQSKPRSQRAKENSRQAVRKSCGTPIESFNLKTGQTIKKYECQADVKLEGYGQGNVANVLAGRLKHAYGLGWRYTLKVHHVG